MKTIVTHPVNYQAVRKLFDEEQPKQERRPFDPFWIDIAPLFSTVKIVTNDAMQRRKIREVWHPPVDRFIEYGPEDERHCRYCGLGWIERIDEGPLFYVIDPTVRVWCDHAPMIHDPKRMLISNFC